ncbi:aldehyde dehydrogenase family protein [Streptomyces malaysiensis subsp. malaysiensis]|uniref:Aldehyde dehydrogenase family protein n=1 Tax=Streptomyces malaysiensis TaxID=92644 RepID=A0ABX6WNC8_STRMQ|nr:aldehyde dehydrogenase family protein [Streptomyces solisilvae]
MTPWNFPLCQAAIKLTPALAAGNAAVLKPSELTSLSAVRLAELALEAGFPEGTLNVVAGAGATTGEALVTHPLVEKISFTGSEARPAFHSLVATQTRRLPAHSPRPSDPYRP